MMRVYLVMNAADAHVDPIFGVFETIEKAKEYIKETVGDGEDGWEDGTDGDFEEAEYALECVSFEVK